MSVLSGLFRWRSRVKTGAPDVAGGIETLSGHVADPNAHSDYLKKGQAVPTGQEQAAMAKHRVDNLAHARTLVRRPELLQSIEEYRIAKDADIAEAINNYTKTNPTPHVVTAYVLAQVLTEFAMSSAGILANVGDGSNLIYSNSSGVLTVSDKTIGSTSKPVYLQAGTLTPVPYDVLFTATDQIVAGVKTFTALPRSSVAPTRNDELVNKQYVDSKTNNELPVGFCVITETSIDTAAKVYAKLGYGTWQRVAELAYYGYCWKRTS